MISKHYAVGMYIFLSIGFAFNILLFGYTYRFMKPDFSRRDKIHIYIIRVFNVFMAVFLIVLMLVIGHVSGLLGDIIRSIFRNIWI